VNERIKLLVEQATTRIDPIAHDGECWDFDKEKFAELIVQECISVINTKATEVPVEDEYERMWKMGTEFAVYQIDKHFGVEE
jgi:hypothetical protein